MSGSAVIAGAVGDRSYALSLWRALPGCDKKQPLSQSPGPCCERSQLEAALSEEGGALGVVPWLRRREQEPRGGMEDTPVTLMKIEADIHFVRSACI